MDTGILMVMMMMMQIPRNERRIMSVARFKGEEVLSSGRLYDSLTKVHLDRPLVLRECLGLFGHVCGALEGLLRRFRTLLSAQK